MGRADLERAEQSQLQPQQSQQSQQAQQAQQAQPQRPQQPQRPVRQDPPQPLPLPIDVVVGILLQSNGDMLLAQRPPGKPYAGYWEFPGGKVEPGEALLAALQREFMEELGIEILSAQPWCGVEHVYEHAHVRLHFFLSHDWRGAPQSLEGQAFAWQGGVEVSPVLPATIPLLEALEGVRYLGWAGR